MCFKGTKKVCFEFYKELLLVFVIIFNSFHHLESKLQESGAYLTNKKENFAGAYQKSAHLLSNLCLNVNFSKCLQTIAVQHLNL